MSAPLRHLCVHGHFYQPPRDDPWLGRIGRQPSAAPDADWNERVARECYAPLAAARVRDGAGRILALENAYRRLSFNVGPTLFDWIGRHRPGLERSLREADDAGGGAIAMPYSHPILPLATARDRHTQIAWGLEEFRHRFGRAAEGLWLPECAIDRNTVRALIDHGVRFVLLSPEQAVAIRPMGEEEWRPVEQGALDTRRAYRVFEVDGAGRTHFDRGLDVLFYDPGLSLRISFEHALRRPEALAAEILSRFEGEEAQLAFIASDGEIYGHHEPRGHEALVRLLALPELSGVKVLTPAAWLEHRPPAWEVRLSAGPDDRGSSWSCAHGVGRWFRDCGCRTGGEEGWTQAWRGPLRAALDMLRAKGDRIFEREAGRLLADPWVARDLYIRVVLSPDAQTRRRFLAGQGAAALPAEAQVRVWELLEAQRLLLESFTSCGWFFCDLAGLEPIRNLRCALRAAELLQPYVEEDLAGMLRGALAAAKGNDGRDGAAIFDALVASARVAPETIAAAAVLGRLLGLEPLPSAWTAEFSEMPTEASGRPKRALWGEVVLTDRRTLRAFGFAFYAVASAPQCAGVLLAPSGDREMLRRLWAATPAEAEEEVRTRGIQVSDLPAEEKERILERLLAPSFVSLEANLRQVHDGAIPLLLQRARHGIEPPAVLRAVAEHVLESRLGEWVEKALGGEAPERSTAAVAALLAEAKAHGLVCRRGKASLLFARGLARRIVELDGADAGGCARTAALAHFGLAAGLDLGADPGAEEQFAALLAGIDRMRNRFGTAWPQAAAALISLGEALGFAPEAMTALER